MFDGIIAFIFSGFHAWALFLTGRSNFFLLLGVIPYATELGLMGQQVRVGVTEVEVNDDIAAIAARAELCQESMDFSGSL